MEELIQRCKNHLKKEPDDVPIRRKCNLLKTVVAVRNSSSITKLSNESKTLARILWEELEKYSNWYHSDIILVGTLLSYVISIDSIEDAGNLLLERLEKYKDFKKIQPTILSYYRALAFYLLEQRQYLKSIFFSSKLITLAKQEKRYDQLARGYVYLGIAEKKQELIDKGLQILELTDEQNIFENLKHLIKHHQTD
ncbi:TPA: hypothetical protein ACGO8I_000813 [Streptococcus suis]